MRATCVADVKLWTRDGSSACVVEAHNVEQIAIKKRLDEDDEDERRGEAVEDDLMDSFSAIDRRIQTGFAQP